MKDRLNELSDKIEEGLKLSFEKLIAFKRYKNTPFIFSENEKVIEVSVDQIEAKLKQSKDSKTYNPQKPIHFVNGPSKKTKQRE